MELVMLFIGLIIVNGVLFLIGSIGNYELEDELEPEYIQLKAE